MLISPPFLPEQNGTDEDAWIDSAMVQPENEGAYPVTQGLAWHGGMHLVSPGNLPVRAIADGTVVFVRGATPRNANPADPLNYHAGEAVAGWTSDGCVVIQHDTEIGQGPNAAVRFYSIYMHLEDLAPAIVRGRPVYRKETLGQPGLINGRPGRLHLEIICDDANLARFVGRTSGNLPLSSHGRRDALYGDIHAYLPAGTVFYATRPPHPTATGASIVLPPVVHTSTEPLFVSIRRLGSASITTRMANGSPLAPSVVTPDEEYLLYKTAKAMKTRVQSAAFELLRFGRVIGNDELFPADTPHWQNARFPGGAGWVNLAAPAVRMFSDADFPHWTGWTLVDDSADRDSRMDSPLIRGWLDTNGNGKVTPDEARTRLRSQEVQEKLKRTICKMPTEWSASTIAARWSWLKQATEENPDKLSDTDFAAFSAHVSKLSFWDGAGLPINPIHWHFQPREFIRHMRMCEWYSVPEIARCIPRNSLIEQNVTWAKALARATENHLGLNTLFRKYLGRSRQRHIHAYSQIYIETGVLVTHLERGTGHGKAYGPFYGRGYMQLTWAENFDNYGRFKNLQDQTNPRYADPRITATSTHPFAQNAPPRRWAPRYDVEVVGTVVEHRADSAGFYWVSKSFRGTSNINRVCDIAVTPTQVGFINWLVNGGGAGYPDRQQYAEQVKNVLFDRPWLAGTTTLRFPPLTEALNGHFPPAITPYTATVRVDYTRQVP